MFINSNILLCFHYFCIMDIPSKYIQDAVEQLASLPGIGKRTALRLVLNLMKRSTEEIELFSNSFRDMKSLVRICDSCGNVTDTARCNICSDPRRDSNQICIVEDIRDIMAIEATQTYKGIYHVLGGIISPMDGVSPNDLNIAPLIEKAATGELTEIIFALSATMEGDTTNFYLYKKISPYNIKVTTLSRGVSIGTELQYADEITLGRSLIQRQPFQM
jgi:recombination protein RecR